MEKTIAFGTYNVPSTSDNLSATYTVPGVSSIEVVNKIVIAKKPEQDLSEFDKALASIMSVPKPAKAAQ